MRRFIVGFFAVIGALVSLIIAALVALAIWGTPASTPVAEGTVLSLNLTEGLSVRATEEAVTLANRVTGGSDSTSNSAASAQEAFDDLALAVSVFEADEAKGLWTIELLYAARPDMPEINTPLATIGAPVA